MGMTPAAYFESFVQGNSDDCHDNPGCIRRAFNAAVAASHLADHYFTFYSRHNPKVVASFPSIGSYVKHVVNQTAGAFRDIRSIANAYKHLYTDVDPRLSAHSSVNSAGSIDLIELPADPVFARVSEEYETDRFVVVFTRKNGSKLEFLPALERVVGYWREVIYDGA